MPKRIPDQELDAILAIVAAHPEGVQVGTIREGLPYQLPPRMLQRRLALLVEQKRLAAEGRAKGRRYRLPPADIVIRGKSAQLALTADPGEVGLYLPVSPEAKAIRASVREPIQNRRPVGYQRDFLDDYRPNE